MKREPSSYYPIFLNVSGKKCVVVGGGQVALRKVGALLDNGANVEVISPDLCPELNKLAETREIAAQRKLYQAGDLKGALIVIAATDDHGINLEVVKEAKRTGVLVNVVDGPDNSDFIVPSCLRRGNVTIAVSTAGRSPALARKIRARLEKDLGDEYAALALLIGEVRAEIKRLGIKVNGDDWQKAMDLDLLIDLLKKNDGEKARELLRNNLKALQK
jgi:precorrin-2 dehydrogenase/sirohydrochlorin ferrochelatase